VKTLKLLAIILQTIILLAPLIADAADKLTLKEAIDRALANSPQLKTVAHDSIIAKENVELSKSSYLPKIDLQAGYTNLLDPQAIKMPTGSFETQDSRFPFLSLGIYQTVYDFGRRERRSEQAILQESAIKSGFNAAKQDVALAAIQTYYSILQTQHLLDTAKDEVAQREQHLKIATSLFEEGVTTRNDLLQADVKLSSSRLKLLAQQNRLKNSWLIMNNLIGQPPEFRAELAEDTLPLPGENSVHGAGSRDEVTAQKSVISASEAAVKESRNEFYPELFVRGSVDYLKNDKVVEQTMYGITIGLKVNLFDGMASTARERQAVKQLAKEKERLREMESGYRIELQSARNDLEVAAERIEITKKAIGQSEENLRINNDRYKAQVGTATDVVDAQTLLSQTKSDYYQALFDLQVAKARVKRAAGEL
jgi:outer membrane protein TolC